MSQTIYGLAGFDNFVKNFKNTQMGKDIIKAAIKEDAHKIRGEVVNIFEDAIWEYYKSFNPKKYIRTYEMAHSVYADIVDDNDGKISLKVGFYGSQTQTDSVIGEKWNSGYNKVDLINFGWETEQNKANSIENFTKKTAAGFIGKAIAEIKQKYGDRVEVNFYDFNGELRE